VQAPLMADGASRNVEPGEPQHQRVHRFIWAGSGGRGLVQQLAAARELRAAGAVGEEAEVADAHEAVGDDMEQEAADELRRLQLHHLDAVAVGVVLPAEAHQAVVEAEEPLVGERHAVGIAARYSRTGSGPAKGRLAYTTQSCWRS